jgi:integrase
VFEKALTKAKLRHVRLHDLRHTFASHLIQNGESLAYVRGQLGHGSITVTVNTHSHLVPGSNRAAVDRLDTTSPRIQLTTTVDGRSCAIGGSD